VFTLKLSEKVELSQVTELFYTQGEEGFLGGKFVNEVLSSCCVENMAQ